MSKATIGFIGVGLMGTAHGFGLSPEITAGAVVAGAEEGFTASDKLADQVFASAKLDATMVRRLGGVSWKLRTLCRSDLMHRNHRFLD